MEYQSHEELYKNVAIIIIVIMGAVIAIILLDDSLTGGAVKSMLASMLFWIPFGSIFQGLTQGMAAIPG